MIKKILSSVLILAMLLSFTACGDDLTDNRELGENPNDTPSVVDVDEGEKPFDEVAPKDNLFLVVKKLNGSGSFRTVTTGQCVTKVVVTVEQKIYSERVVVGNAFFKSSTSYSGVVKFGLQCYSDGSRYFVREAKKVNSLTDVKWETCVTEYCKKEFIDEFGVTGTGLCNYVLTDESVLSVISEKEDGGYMLICTLDTVKATPYSARENKHNAGSKKYPEYKSVGMTLHVTDDRVVRYVEYESVYIADKFGGVTCNETMTETFYDIGQINDITQKSYFIN